MANDRLYLRCRVCRKGFMLYKYYPGGGFVPEKARLPASNERIPSTPFREALDAWLTMHLQECEGQHGFAATLDEMRGFDVVNESGLITSGEKGAAKR